MTNAFQQKSQKSKAPVKLNIIFFLFWSLITRDFPRVVSGVGFKVKVNPPHFESSIPDDSTESSLHEILFPPGGLEGGKKVSSSWSLASSKLRPTSSPSSLLFIPEGSRLDFRVEAEERRTIII